MTKSQAQELARLLWQELGSKSGDAEARVDALVQQLVRVYRLPEPAAGQSPIEVPLGDGAAAIVLEPADGRYLAFAGTIGRNDDRSLAVMTRDGRPALLKGDDPLAGAFRSARRIADIRL